MLPIEIPGRGRLYSWTVTAEREDAPEDFRDFVPYAEGIFELQEGVKVTGRITDVPRNLATGKLDRSYLQIGAQFEMVTRVMRKNGKKDLIEYGPLWRPTLNEEVRERFSSP